MPALELIQYPGIVIVGQTIDSDGVGGARKVSKPLVGGSDKT